MPIGYYECVDHVDSDVSLELIGVCSDILTGVDEETLDAWYADREMLISKLSLGYAITDQSLYSATHFFNNHKNCAIIATLEGDIMKDNLEIDILDEENIVKESDPVNHPAHYTTGKIEVWDFIVDQKLGYLPGSVVKYLCRAGRKNPETHVEDLHKALAFLQREIKRVETGS